MDAIQVEWYKFESSISSLWLIISSVIICLDPLNSVLLTELSTTDNGDVKNDIYDPYFRPFGPPSPCVGPTVLGEGLSRCSPLRKSSCPSGFCLC